MATLIETCQVSPPPAAAAEVKDITLPLTFFDMYWIHFQPIRRILFYDHPCSKPEFLNTVVPNLKHSLSLTLKHYLPVAGNLLYPSNTQHKPVIRYTEGDSIKLVIAESSRDFDELTAVYARDSDQFYDYVPEMSCVRNEEGWKILPLVALQATLLPGRGICLGFVFHHCLGDGRSLNAGFAFSWASINKSDHGSVSIPNFDRSFIEDSMGIDTIFWEIKKQIPLDSQPSLPLPTRRVRATYTIRQPDIEKLKNRVLTKKPRTQRVSSYVVTISYIWSCLAKSDDDRRNVLEQLNIPVDGRGRLRMSAETTDPPALVPYNYFGNCIGLATTTLQHEVLAGEEGFVTAAEAVTEEIRRRVENAEELLRGAENWLSEMGMQKCGSSLGMKVFSVVGYPKFDLSEADFGWGKAAKMENLTIDEHEYLASLCTSKEAGALEFGLSLPMERMEAFAAVFADGLSKI